VTVFAAGFVLATITGAWGYGTQPGLEIPVAKQVAGKVEVRFSSAIADPYYVLSGPVESYESFHFNGMFRGALERYAAAKSGPGEGLVKLVVHLERLSTGYRQLGAGLPPAGAPLARAGRLQLASADAGAPLGLISQFRDDGGDWSFPEEITKSAALGFAVEVQSAGSAPSRESLSVSADVTVTWDDLDPWGPQWSAKAYAYGPVLEAVTRNAIRRIDALLEGVVRSPGT
jgi:hypothetical protein